MRISANRQPRSSCGRRLHQPFDSASGSIGTTRSGKYVLLPRSRAAWSSAVPGGRSGPRRRWRRSGASRCPPARRTPRRRSRGRPRRRLSPAEPPAGPRARQAGRRAPLAAACRAASGKTCGIACVAMEIMLTARASPMRPSRSTTRAGPGPSVRWCRGRGSASTISPASAPFSSPGGTNQADLARRSVGSMRSPADRSRADRDGRCRGCGRGFRAGV